jgi:hypothetical protein
LQEKLEEQLRPLFALLEDIQGRLAKGGKVPNFGSLKDWALVSHFSSSLLIVFLLLSLSSSLSFCRSAA